MYLAAPKQVGLADDAAIGGGQTHSVAVQTEGTVRAWGHNAYDQLCGGTSSSLPVTVYTPGANQVRAVGTTMLKRDGDSLDSQSPASLRRERSVMPRHRRQVLAGAGAEV